jgi:hypothetical protein
MADDHLVAVFTVVSPAETGEEDADGGWFLEAGFGPCSAILTTMPPIFATIDEAQSWVHERVTQERMARS